MHQRTSTDQRECKYNTSKTDGYELAYGYTYTSTCDFFSPIFYIPEVTTNISVKYEVKTAWWQTGAKSNNTSSRLNLGLTSGLSRHAELQATMTEASKSLEWGIESTGSYAVETSSLTDDKCRVVIYFDNRVWSLNTTQHFVVLNYFNIEYR